MAARGCSTILRRLAPTSNLGDIVSNLVENPSSLSQPLQSPFRYYSLQSSETISPRSFSSRSAFQSPDEITDKGSGSHTARSDRNCRAEEQLLPRQTPLGSLQISASLKLNMERLDETEDNAVEQKLCKGKPTSKSAERPRIQQRNAGRPKVSPGELTGEADQPSAYVSSDFVDHRAMQLVFLGTSSSIPTLNRSTSCIALRLEGCIFLFDCGEGALRQILKTPMKHYDISNIFITHMHGDHVSNFSVFITSYTLQ